VLSLKIDRLLGITMYLLNRDLVSGRALAEKFEVSPRTIQRDIEALNLAGIPVTSQPGSTGGYRIVAGFKLDKQLSSAEDDRFILTALKGLCSAYEDRKLDATLEKMTHFARQKRQLPQTLFLDFGVLRENPATERQIKTIESALASQKAVAFDYTNADNQTRRRVVEPIAITYQWYAWYLLGYCTEKHDYRLFKLARLSHLQTTDLPVGTVHPPAEALLKIQAERNAREYYDIELLCRKRVRQPVLEYLRGQIVAEYENGDFRMALRLPRNERMWFSLMMGFGDGITVLAPDELKRRLLEKAREILNQYPEMTT
jgi:predicted DNA-binding transcriptional regulator YafY